MYHLNTRRRTILLLLQRTTMMNLKTGEINITTEQVKPSKTQLILNSRFDLFCGQWCAFYFFWHTIHNNTSLKTKECNRHSRSVAIPECFLRNILEEQKNKIYIIIKQSNSFFISNCAICFMSLMSKNVYMLQPFIIQNNSVHYLHQPRCFIILSENAALTKRLISVIQPYKANVENGQHSLLCGGEHGTLAGGDRCDCRLVLILCVCHKPTLAADVPSGQRATRLSASYTDRRTHAHTFSFSVWLLVCDGPACYS